MRVKQSEKELKTRNLPATTNFIHMDMTNEDIIKFRAAANHASDHIVISDPEGMIIYANRAAEEITGFSQKEMIGLKTGSHELWGGLMSDEFYHTLWQTIKHDKKFFQGEVTNKRKNGSRYLAELSIFPVFDNKHRIIAYVNIEKDINKRKEIERAKTDFISLASHQLRTPLTSISLCIDMLLQGLYGKLPKEQKPPLLDIRHEVWSMTGLIKALLNVSKIELGVFTIETEPIDLINVSKEIIKQIRPQIKNKNLTLRTSYDSSLPAIISNKDIVKMILQNLLSNAVKYTPEKGIITLRLKVEQENVIVSVSDNGWGIPTEAQRRIFDKFFRGQNIRKMDAGGTGLGLYLVKSLLKAMGGKIWFQSEENQGTTFYASIPLFTPSALK